MKKERRIFSAEFKQEAVALVLSKAIVVRRREGVWALEET